MSTLRAGLSGCGAVGARAALQFARGVDCALAALHDADPQALAGFAAAPEVRSRHTDFAALLASGIDFVVLTGPCADRLPLVEAAAAQGVHCLLHAPMAADAATAAAMVRLADAAGIKLGVAVPGEDDPCCDELRRMIRQDAFGALALVQAVTADDHALRHPPAAPADRRAGLREGRGALRRLASGDLHLVHWLSGRAALRVTAQSARGLTALDEDSAVATALLRGGVLATLAASHVASGRQLALHGTDGHALLTADRVTLRSCRDWDGAVFGRIACDHEHVLPLAALAAAIDAAAPPLELHHRFARWIDDLDDFPCPGELAAEDLRVLDALDRAVHPDRSEPV